MTRFFYLFIVSDKKAVDIIELYLLTWKECLSISVKKTVFKCTIYLIFC